jgi:hypothetical protein
MTWVSLVCLLALSSSALGHYGNAFRARVANIALEQRRPFLTSVTLNQPQTATYGQAQVSTYSAPLTTVVQKEQILTAPATYTASYGTEQLKPLTVVQTEQPKLAVLQPQVATYGAYGAQPKMFEQVKVEVIKTQWDIMCQGQRAETVIPLDDGRHYVVCLDESKGVELWCPKGLFYRPELRRCERKLIGNENPCALQPCLNGGQCLTTDITSYQCQCPAGFDGKNCELDARVCQTQQPCGQADSRCQSFRAGAALSYVCICQQESGYGASCAQFHQNPCQGIDGPQRLLFTDKGFLMCDGERFFIESCPGGTVWYDEHKACTWPDMVGIATTTTTIGSQQEQTRISSVSTYGETAKQWEQPMISTIKVERPIERQIERPFIASNYGEVTKRIEQPFLEVKRIEQPIMTSYGQPARQLDLQVSSPYGEVSKRIEQPLVEVKRIEQPILSTYGQRHQQLDFIQPKQTRDY